MMTLLVHIPLLLNLEALGEDAKIVYALTWGLLLCDTLKSIADAW